MGNSVKRFTLAGMVVAVVLATFLVLKRSANGPASELIVAASEAAPEVPAETPHSSFYARVEPKPATTTAQEPQPAAAAAASSASVEVWQAKVDEVLAASQPEADKAKQLLELFPQLPAALQPEAALHISNLLPDEDFGLLRGCLTNATLPAEVSDVLLGEVLNRPNALKLPALLDIARTAQHPNAAEAKDYLELLLDEDYGDNWDQWQSRMQQWLTENPD